MPGLPWKFFPYLRLRMCAAGHIFLLCIDELWPTHPPRLFSCTLHMSVCLCLTVALFLSLASQAFCGLVSPFRLFCIFCWHVLVNALLAPGALPALGVLVALVREPRARASVMNIKKRALKFPGKRSWLAEGCWHMLQEAIWDGVSRDGPVSVLFSWRDYTIELEKPIRRGVFFKRCDEPNLQLQRFLNSVRKPIFSFSFFFCLTTVLSTCEA